MDFETTKFFKRLKPNVQEEFYKVLDSYGTDVLEFISNAESPVEELFGMWLHRLADEFRYSTLRPRDPEDFFEIDSQSEVDVNGKKYRVDFTLDYVTFLFGQPFDYYTVFVEIDGHEFHEKTKEQVRHDKERERAIAPYANEILRYSGSEIYDDPWGYANEAMQHLVAGAREINKRRIPLIKSGRNT